METGKIRVCHVTNYLPGMSPVWGGAEQATWRLIQAQKETDRIEPEVLASRHVRFQELGVPLHLLPTLEKGLPLAWERRILNAKGRFFPMDPLAGRAARRRFLISKPDLIHFHNLNVLSLSLIQEARRLGIPSLLSVYDYWLFCPHGTLFTVDGKPCRIFHGVQCVDCRGYTFLAFLQRWLFGKRRAWFDERIAPIGFFLPLSKASADLLRAYGIPGERIRVLRQCLPMPEKKTVSSVPIDPHEILFIGWMERRKGLHVVIEALGILCREFQDASLTVLALPSEASYEEEVRRRAEILGVANRIEWLGEVSSEVMEERMAAAGVFVVAEQWENMSPVVLAEAMARGKPIVAGRIGGIPEYIRNEEDGLLVPFDSPRDFAGAMSRLLLNPSLAERLGSNASRRAEKLWKNQEVVSDCLDIYKELLRAGLPGSPENPQSRM